MTKYTFTFPYDEEGKFKSILSRLDESEYNILEKIAPVNAEDAKYSDRQAIIEMDSDSALTFRMGMKELKIRRERTEEELKAEKEIEERHKVKVIVKTGPVDTNAP